MKANSDGMAICMTPLMKCHITMPAIMAPAKIRRKNGPISVEAPRKMAQYRIRAMEIATMTR